MKDSLDFSTQITVTPRSEKLHALLETQIRQGLHPAAQMVVVHQGEVLYDQALGMARGKPVLTDTPFLTFSCTKAFTAMCIHKLVEEGRIELDAPVAAYWPQFGVKGKEKATIRHVLTHHAGLPWGHGESQIPLWPFWRLTAWDTARTPAEYPPGEKFAYHVVSFGFILGEVLRRVTGLPIHRYFDKAFAEPLGMRRSWLKMRITKLPQSPRLYSGCEDQDGIVRLFNKPLLRTASIPAGGLNSTARDMAVFYNMLVNGGVYDGRRYLKEETIKQATTLAFEGWDHLVEREVRYALGFYIGGRPPTGDEPGPPMGSGSSLSSFGHFGNRSCMAWGDHDAKLAVAFLCNRLLSMRDTRQRWTDISNAVWEMIG